MATSGQIVEHVVLFRARDGVGRESIGDWMQAVRSLADLEGVLHLYVGKVVSCKPDDAAWSFAIYGRFCDKAALQAYAVHPRHLDVVSLGGTLFLENMALDWEASVGASPAPAVPCGFRVVFLQWKQPGVFNDDVMAWFGSHPLSTSGPNFSPARARGFVWGFVALQEDKDVQHADDVGLHALSNGSAVEKFLFLDIDISVPV